MFYLILFLLSQCSVSIGYFVSTLVSKEETAATLAPVLLIPMLLFGGFFANSSHIPEWISWFQYVSPIRYAFEALIRNQFEGVNLPPGGIDLVKYLGFKLGLPYCLIILLCISVILRVIAFVFLKLLV